MRMSCLFIFILYVIARRVYFPTTLPGTVRQGRCAPHDLPSKSSAGEHSLLQTVELLCSRFDCVAPCATPLTKSRCSCGRVRSFDLLVSPATNVQTYTV